MPLFSVVRKEIEERNDRQTFFFKMSRYISKSNMRARKNEDASSSLLPSLERPRIADPPHALIHVQRVPMLPPSQHISREHQFHIRGRNCCVCVYT